MDNIWKNFRDYKEEYFKDLKDLISVDSSLTGDKTYPNQNIQKALSTFVKIGDRFGMKSFTHPEGYYGYIEIGQGEEMIGVIGHMDVVPQGELDKWETPPFELTITDDGFARGRGVQDDKGPTLLCLYAMKIIKDSGIELNRRIRIIFGTDEESEWRGIEKYVQEQEKPIIGFTPDASWPVIYAEKAALSPIVSEKNKPTEDIVAGTALNVVPSKATIKTNKDKADIIEKELKSMKQKYERFGNTITVIGKPFHAKDSFLGDNAIMKLSRAMKETTNSKLIKFFDEAWNLDTFAPNIFGKKWEDKELGLLTTNIGTIELNSQGNLSSRIDFRVPHPKIDRDMVVSKFEAAVKKYDLNLEWGIELPEVYMSKDSTYIKTLVETYQKHTGDTKTKPIASGGATYAKSMPNLVAFGPQFPHSKSTIHQENERILVEDLMKSGEIYTDTLIKLLKMKKLI